MLFQCLASVEDGGPTLKQHWVIVPCLNYYYSKLLPKHINDVKGTWKILNNVIKKKNGTCTSFTEFFKVGLNGTTISD